MSALPRRPFLGLAVRPAADGLEVTRVLEGASAALAGVRVGDVLVTLDDSPLTSARTLAGALRESPATLVFLRAGARSSVALPALRLPNESIEGLRYGSVTVRGHRWRTIEAGVGETRGPAVLYLAGIATGSLDFARRESHPMACFFRGLAEAGVHILRLERSGTGDSEGPSAESISVEHEIEGYRAALAKLRADSQVGSVIAFGHSIGGMLAPALDCDGYVLYGSSARRWSRCLRESLNRQRALLGAPPLTRLEPSEYGRTPGFHEALDAMDLPRLWSSRPGVPVTVIAGEHDVVVGADEQRELAAITEGELKTIEGLDHAFSTHATALEALHRLGAGAPCPALVDAVRDSVSAPPRV